MDSLAWPGRGAPTLDGATVSQILADLLAGLNAEQAALHERSADGGRHLLLCIGHGCAAPAGWLPELADGAVTQTEDGDGHLALAAMAAPGGQLVLAVRRARPLAARDLRLLRAVLRGVTFCHGNVLDP